MRKFYDVVIVGGGAAGMIAAGKAASNSKSVLLIEKKEKCGRKVRITGKGRCNITNSCSTEEFLQKVKSGAEFVRPALEAFGSADIIELLESQNVRVVCEQGGRIFPMSGKAWDVAGALERYAKAGGAEIENYCAVSDITKTADNKWVIKIDREGMEMKVEAGAVVIATGGASYPLTGSTGDGYAFAHNLGHTIEPLRPSLVSLDTRNSFFAAINYLELKNVEISLEIDGQIVQTEFGQFSINKEVLEGALILKVSRRAVDALIDNRKVGLRIDLKPALSTEQLVSRMSREQEARSAITVEELLRKMLPSPLVAYVASSAGLNRKLAMFDVSEDQRQHLANQLKAAKLPITDYGGFSEAVVTAGGVSLGEVDSQTMQSKIVSGLYFIGEVLDIDADTGGYNLQLAFSTGYLCGKKI